MRSRPGAGDFFPAPLRRGVLARLTGRTRVLQCDRTGVPRGDVQPGDVRRAGHIKRGAGFRLLTFRSAQQKPEAVREDSNGGCRRGSRTRRFVMPRRPLEPIELEEVYTENRDMMWRAAQGVLQGQAFNGVSAEDIVMTVMGQARPEGHPRRRGRQAVQPSGLPPKVCRLRGDRRPAKGGAAASTRPHERPDRLDLDRSAHRGREPQLPAEVRRAPPEALSQRAIRVPRACIEWASCQGRGPGVGRVTPARLPAGDCRAEETEGRATGGPRCLVTTWPVERWREQGTGRFLSWTRRPMSSTNTCNTWTVTAVTHLPSTSWTRTSGPRSRSSSTCSRPATTPEPLARHHWARTGS